MNGAGELNAERRPRPRPIRGVRTALAEGLRRLPAAAARFERQLIVVAVLLLAWPLGGSSSRALLAAVYGAVGVVVLLRWRRYGLLVLVGTIAFVPIEIGTGTQSTINATILAVAGLTGVWGLERILRKNVRLEPTLENLAWLLLIAVTGLSIVAGAADWSPFVDVGATFPLVQIAQWSLFVLSACAYWLGAYWPGRRQEVRWLVLASLALSVIFLLREFGLVPGPVARLFELDATVSRIWYAAIPAGFALFGTAGRPGRRAVLALLAVAVCATGTVRTLDWVSGWLPASVAVGTIVLLWIGSRAPAVALLLIVPAATIAAWTVTRVLALEQWSMNTRLIAWTGLVELVGDRWLFGLGLASYWHYWRGVIGSFGYFDPASGYYHVTLDPRVNMHNNFIDIYGQAGLAGVVAMLLLALALVRLAWRTWRRAADPFARSYAAAGLGALAGMAVAGNLGDWLIPFVYNIGLAGYSDAALGWLLLGGVGWLAHEGAGGGGREA